LIVWGLRRPQAEILKNPMNSLVLSEELKNLLHKLPVSVNAENGRVCLRAETGFSALTWKEQPLSLKSFSFLWQDFPELETGDHEVSFPSDWDLARFAALRPILRELQELIVKENMNCLEFWGRSHDLVPSGFHEGRLPTSSALLAALYADGLMVAEKKNFVLDLSLCQGPYLVGHGDGHPSIIDAASQIASHAIGANHPSRGALLLRPELRREDLDFGDWDVAQAFARMLREESGLEHVQFCNSGAEACEVALRSIHLQHPQRRRLVAFDGSFHGRTLLALHATHSPSKRVPFEIYPELVDFLPWPETKTPHEKVSEPRGWLNLWSRAREADFEGELAKIDAGADALLKQEIESLRQARASLLKELPLAVLVEPMQCEGGDRYATARFFRGLRALTRAFDVAMVLDEVQTGFGLGGPFFWFKLMNLETVDGQPDVPDALYLAKKSQVGVSISRYPQTLATETSAASLYRGYVQAMELRDFDARDLNKRALAFLAGLQQVLGTDLVSSPRGRALCFAFDLPSEPVLNALVSKRFPNGLLFYPAGTRTARFRLLAGMDDEELVHIFRGLYRCFEDVARDGLIPPVPPLSAWLDTLTAHNREFAERAPNFERDLPWGQRWQNISLDALKQITDDRWDRLFYKMARHHPQLMQSDWNLRLPLAKLDTPVEKLWALYQSDPRFTRLDLTWACARFRGTRLHRLDAEGIRLHAAEIDALELQVYEAARVTPASEFLDYARDPECIVQVALDETGAVVGICGSAPLRLFKESVATVGADPHRDEKGFLYSFDLTLSPKYQGRGLGMRFKCEQFIAAWAQGSRFVRSQNRDPDAKVMARLNFRLGAATIARNTKAYGGTGTALYQSSRLPHDGDPRFLFSEESVGSLKNKMTLSNFVSPSYIRNTRILGQFLPASHRHLYFASGRAEAIDKSLRLLRHFRPQGKAALSFEGDYFGETTAVSRSLGGPWPARYFDWPLVKNPTTLSRLLASEDPTRFLGLYVEPLAERSRRRRSENELHEILATCKQAGVPVVFGETASAFGAYDPSRFLAACETLQPDLAVFYPGGQIAVVATTRAYFLEKPLQLISTWDGDEFSLIRLKERLFGALPQSKG
jgi:4-aminobutyrate aminotransferase-like enzyme